MAHSKTAAATTTYIDENSEDGELAADDEDIGRPPPAKALRKGPRTPPEPHNKNSKREEGMSPEDDTEDSLDIKPPQAQTVQHAHGNRQRHREKKEKERQHGAGGSGSSSASGRKGEHRVSSKERYSTRDRGGYHAGEKRKAPSGDGSRVENSTKRKEKESLVRRGTSRGNEFLRESAKDQRDALAKDGGSGMRVIRDARDRIRDREKEKEDRERVERERLERVEREKRRDRLIYAERERERQREHQKRELEKRQLTKKDGDVIILGTGNSHRSRNGTPEKSRSERHEEGKKSKDSKHCSSLETSRNSKEQEEEMESPVSLLDESEEEHEFEEEEQYKLEKSEEEEVNVSEQDNGSEREERSDTDTDSQEER